MAALLPPDHPDLETVLQLIVEHYEEEFLFSPFSKDASPAFVAALIWHGFLPMAHSSRSYMLPKIHRERCVIKPAEVHVGRQARKRAKQYRLTVDKAWGEVVTAVQRHTFTRRPGDNWLCQELVDAYEGVKALPEEQRRGVSFHSIELWHIETGTLAAGEIGYSVGGVYTSATGFCLKEGFSGAGTVQLAVLGRWLAKCGFELWDLGMVMDYKRELGVTVVPRKEWIRRLHEFRERRCSLTSPGENDPSLPELLGRELAGSAAMEVDAQTSKAAKPGSRDYGNLDENVPCTSARKAA